MRITVICTALPTSLTIETSERVDLEQMEKLGDPRAVRPLGPGLTIVTVDPGVYKLQSSEVRVAADSPNAQVMTVNSKDDPPEGLAVHVDRAAIRQFLASAKSVRDL